MHLNDNFHTKTGATLSLSDTNELLIKCNLKLLTLTRMLKRFFLKKGEPGQVAVLGLPSPFGVEQIRPAILSTPKPLIKKATIFRLVQWILLIPHPISIKQITSITLFLQKLYSFIFS